MKPHVLNATQRIWMAVLFVLTFAVLLSAQSTTDGAIGGTIYDTTGAVVGGATVLVHSTGTNAEKTVAADGAGNYRVTSLQPGTYTVTIKGGSGFASYKAEQVIVQVGSVTEVSPHRGARGTTEIVDVTAEAPQVNSATPEFAPTLDQTAIANLPINGGRWSNFAVLTPGVVSNSSGFGLLSFRGISTLLNNNTVDGADNNQAFFSEERGRTRIGYSTPKAAVQEFQVNTSNYSAEYGRSAGGVINTVTKSGTNGIHGEGYFYDRDNVWGAANAFTSIATQATPGGPFTTSNFKPTDWRKMAGFGIGGPLVKDKLFWFVAYDWYHRNFPGTGVVTNPNVFFAPPTPTQITAFSTNMGISPDAATTLYNTDLTALTSMLGTVPRTGVQNIIYPKIDWVIDSRNRASFSFNRMRWSSPAGIQTQATNSLGIASFGSDYVKNTWGVAKLDSMITNNFANQIRFQYGRDFEFEFAQPPTPYEVTNVLKGGLSSPGYVNPLGLPPSININNGNGSGLTFGVPTFLQRYSFPDEVRMQVADTMTWTHGKHTVKYGVDFSHVDDLSQNLRTQFGSYNYSNANSLVNYFTDLNKQNGCAGKPCYNANTGYQQAFGPLGFEFTTNDYALFVQDDWKILPRLSVSLGLRYEYEAQPEPFQNLINPAVPQTAKMPNDQNNFGPRAGFAWSVTGDGKTVLRGGWGLYYGRVINSTVFNALTSTGMPGGQFSFSFNPGTAPAPVFPKIIDPASAFAIVKPNITYFDPHFQNPQIHQIDLTLERELGWGTVVSVCYLGSLGRELPNFVDTNVCNGTDVSVGNVSAVGCRAPGTITYTVNGGFLQSPTYTTPFYKPFSTTQARPNAAFAAMTDIFSGVNSSYHAFVVQVNHRMSHHVQFSVNYTRSHSIDFGQNETTFSSVNSLLRPDNIGLEKGNSQYNIPNRFVVSAVINSPWNKTGLAGWFANGWEFSPIYQIQNGNPYTLGVSGTLSTAVAAGPFQTALGGINGSNGSGRFDILGPNSFHGPALWVADVRLSKHFKLKEDYDLEVMGDFFNLANKQNVTGISSGGYAIATSGTGCSTAAPCLNPQTSFGTINNTNSNITYTPRQVQLGARFRF